MLTTLLSELNFSYFLMLKGCSCFVGNLLVIHSGKVIHLFSTLFAQVMNKLFTHCFFLWFR